MVQGILNGVVMQVVSKEMFSGTRGREMIEESLSDLDRNTTLSQADKNALRSLLHGVEAWNERQESIKSSDREAGGLTMPYETSEEAVTSGSGVQYNGYAHSFAGMGVQFVLFMRLDVGIGLLLQRQRGLWTRLRAAPLSRAVLLGSRTISAAIIAIFILLVIFSFARLVFGVRIEGSIVGFLGVCLAFSLMTAAFGLMIAAIGKTPEATRGVSILATLVMVMLGGPWVPTFIFPLWLQKITVVVPTRWAMDGLDAMVWRGLGFSAAIWPTFFGLFAGVALARFRWEI
jgi:ABC-2 type transport system permease protein